MTKFASLVVAVSLALTASAAAAATDGDATLRVDRGSIMTSQGGEFASAQSGKVLVDGERLMVTEGAAATVFYDNGCKREYTAPGVYVVDADCAPAAVIAGSGATNWTAASAVLSGVAGGALLLQQMKDTDDRPCRPERSGGTGRPDRPGCSPVSR